MHETDRTRRKGKTNRQAEAGQKLGECEVKRIYISGPMTWIEDLNRAEFEAAWLELRKKGLGGSGIVVPPWVADSEVWDQSTPIWLIAFKLINKLSGCDAIYMLRGWENSKGARAEHAVAVWIGLEIIYQGVAKCQIQ